MTGCAGRWSSAGILAISGCLLACNPAPLVNPSSVNLSSDQQALVITSVDPALSDQFTLKHLPTESKVAPGLYFHPKRFDLVQVSPDGRFAAFSTMDHHTLVGLLNLGTMAAQRDRRGHGGRSSELSLGKRRSSTRIRLLAGKRLSTHTGL